jgi:hypothetical protein
MFGVHVFQGIVYPSVASMKNAVFFIRFIKAITWTVVHFRINENWGLIRVNDKIIQDKTIHLVALCWTDVKRHASI